MSEHVLVAPVVTEGERRRRLYLPTLPDGKAWIDFHTRARFGAGVWQEVDAPLHQLPLFVVEGAELAMAAPMAGALPKHDDPVSELIRF
jgi:alpha-glucosidase (family GH31 glycosyl hydrolase)